MLSFFNIPGWVNLANKITTMKYIKAARPVNAGRIGPDMPLTKNTVHKQVYMETLQNEYEPGPPIYSKLKLTINEDYRDIIWLGIEVDGKFHDLTHLTGQIFEELKKLSEPE